MFEKIGKFFTALVAFVGTILTFFLMFKSKEQSDLEESFYEDKTSHEKDISDSENEHEQEQTIKRVKYETALRDLSDANDKDIAKLQEKYGKDVADIYEKNREDPEKLVQELSEEYGLDDV